nr:Rho GDP-dissociation inhibitor 1-like [Tanacetum cinerariifolium]
MVGIDWLGALSMYMDLGDCLWAPANMSLSRKRSPTMKALNAKFKGNYSIVPFAATIFAPGQMDLEVRLYSLGISKDVEEITISLPPKEALSGRPLFTLREGAHYRFKLAFTVLHNIVSGLT